METGEASSLLATFPKIAAEADGWDPSEVFWRLSEYRDFKCSEGHQWTTKVLVRTYMESGCPGCNYYGFNVSKPAWIYLMERPGEQQFGITNYFDQRMRQHSQFNWTLLD